MQTKLAPALAEVAQQVYDKWDEDPDCYAGGGICHLIAEEMAGKLSDHGIDAQTVSQEIGDQHVYVVAKLKDGVYSIDVPPGVYETGGGYTWKKIKDVQITKDDIAIDKIDGNPNKFHDYIEMAADRFALGGEGSGNFGHLGRPGEVGGSGAGDGRSDDALDAVADLAVSDEMQELEEAWAGGVADFGDEMAAQAIQNAPGYEDYQKDISDTLRQKLGDSITVYRSVTPDEHDDWTEGGGPQGIVGVTLDPEVAQKWEKFAGNKAGRKVITFPIDPARVIMRGKREESEIVVDADYVSQSEVKSLGGVGSGNFGHVGRPGEVGGSGPGGESDVQEDGTLRPGVLKDEPSRYFHIDDQTEMVPIAKLQTIRARPEGIKNAEPLMKKAYEGVGGKRKPVSLERQADGTYTVLDGNSTTAIARKHGWDKIPAHVTHAQTLAYRAKLAMLLGGEGSGNFGHAGRPGEVGGSSSEGGIGPDSRGTRNRQGVESR